MGSKKNLVEEDIAKLIETEEQWRKISGDDCEHDMLHVVELFSTWGGPAEAINSTLKRFAVDYKGKKLKFFKMDSKLMPEFEAISISSKPVFVLFKEGEQVEVVEGLNTPLLEKLIHDTLPEGVMELEEEGGGEEEED
mmetsp:Transcript_1637/g.4606  ORF Transcript_1637/g.4606 Transcript_1637/m.4606 type:complete len:138 (+) Transcript_1637:102-515(+)